MKDFCLIGIGVATGAMSLVLATIFFRVPSPGILFLLTSGSGIVSAYSAADYMSGIRRQKYISKQELDQAIGRLQERYSLTSDQQSLLIAVSELKQELNDAQR